MYIDIIFLCELIKSTCTDTNFSYYTVKVFLSRHLSPVSLFYGSRWRWTNHPLPSSPLLNAFQSTSSTRNSTWNYESQTSRTHPPTKMSRLHEIHLLISPNLDLCTSGSRVTWNLQFGSPQWNRTVTRPGESHYKNLPWHHLGHSKGSKSLRKVRHNVVFLYPVTFSFGFYLLL